MAEKKRSAEAVYFYPEHNISVVAKDKQEADNKLKETLAEKVKEQSNG
jgi:hypothetical protein